MPALCLTALLFSFLFVAVSTEGQTADSESTNDAIFYLGGKAIQGLRQTSLFAARRHGKTRGAIGACPPSGGFSLNLASDLIRTLRTTTHPLIFLFLMGTIGECNIHNKACK